MKERRGLRKKGGGKNSSISPPLDLRLMGYSKRTPKILRLFYLYFSLIFYIFGVINPLALLNWI